MSLWKLAYSNFKRSIKEYIAMILALSFSVFVFFNFQNMIYSDSMEVLRGMKKDYIDTVIQAASIVFGIFLFFFIWYATNVFLNQRKKEIGIYVFLGLDNRKIGKMYVIEAMGISITAVGTGLLFGIGFSKLFQMVIFKLSGISENVTFSFSLIPVLVTSALFFIFFGIMILKGYFSIVRSSVLHLLSGSKEEEMKEERLFVTFLRVLCGIAVLSAGYVFAIRTGGEETLIYALLAVILVILGTYLLYGGAIPFFVRKLTKNKPFLYQRQRVLCLNQISYRMKKNYRTYAMVTILMICSVTVLAMAIAMKERYDNIIHFKQTYTYQVISRDTLDEQELSDGISKENDVLYHNQIPVLFLDPELFHTEYTYIQYGLVPYSKVKKAAETANLDFSYQELKKDEIIELSHVILMSIVDTQKEKNISIAEKEYKVLAVDETPYLGSLQEQGDFCIVNDEVYNDLKYFGEEWKIYNYRIKDEKNAEASRAYLDTVVKQEDGQYRTGYTMTQAENKEETWIRIFYSLCIFMFATLILASASIIFIKLNNDAWEDKEQYQTLQKIGINREVLKKSIRWEICFAYGCPFVMMTITSWFAVKALGNVMKEDLLWVNIYSAATILALFTLICMISIQTFQGKVLTKKV